MAMAFRVLSTGNIGNGDAAIVKHQDHTHARHHPKRGTFSLVCQRTEDLPQESLSGALEGEKYVTEGGKISLFHKTSSALTLLELNE